MVRGFFSRVGVVIGFVLLPLSMAHAGVVDYTATSLGGSLWRYDYTVNNPSPSIAFDELTVYFDVNRYELLSAAIAPVGWDPIIAQPDVSLPADGFFDALNLGGQLLDGVSVSGFSVAFSYLDSGSPGAQRFELLDSANFSVVLTGTTAAADVPSAVPEPESFTLLLLGLGAAIAVGRAKIRSNP